MAEGLFQGSAITPYLIAKGAEDAIAFYVAAFGAVENYRLVDPQSGKIGHADLAIDGAAFMLADEHPDFGALSPVTVGGTPVKLHLHVADADATVARAERAGATVLRPVQDQMHGERSGMIVDPFGHQWFIGTPIEQVSPEQMQARYDQGA
ncbi:MAG TPA: VOC family protein [Croceibacterium sp.]|nr:VOC family protein [Croceibacterium sp.]